MPKNDNVGKCGHAQCAGGVLCFQKGPPMATYLKMTYDEQYAKAKALWEKAHPNRDYDQHINELVDAAKNPYEL